MEMLERVDQFGKKPELTLTAIITTLLAVVTGRLTAMRDWMARRPVAKEGCAKAPLQSATAPPLVRSWARKMAPQIARTSVHILVPDALTGP